ncbi:MAG: hypothetical protein M3416_14695 [Acidobacteriota bacterium]|nr:hypothetical protein [Acidobacteriota bacterium]
MGASTINGRAALVVAHPGHELQVYGWLEAARPCAFVLSDGSGRGGRPRLAATTKILDRVGASRGTLYGRLSEVEIYRAVLNHDFGVFVGLARELADALVRLRVDYVAGDAGEGYNSTHDLCRLVTNAAVAMAGRERDAEIGNFDFTLSAASGLCPEGLRERAVWLHLDDETFGRKLAAARAYPGLAAEVEAALATHRPESFRVECLRPVESGPAEDFCGGGRPYYEEHGERQVAAGHFEQVIRYRRHVLPVADALRRAVSARGR